MMKKLISVFMALVMILTGLVGCSSQDVAEPEEKVSDRTGIDKDKQSSYAEDKERWEAEEEEVEEAEVGWVTKEDFIVLAQNKLVDGDYTFVTSELDDGTPTITVNGMVSVIGILDSNGDVQQIIILAYVDNTDFEVVGDVFGRMVEVFTTDTRSDVVEVLDSGTYDSLDFHYEYTYSGEYITFSITPHILMGETWGGVGNGNEGLIF